MSKHSLYFLHISYGVFFATLEKNGGESVASDVEILIFCSEGSRV